MNKIDRLWALREERFRWHTQFLSKHEDLFLLPTILPETETTWLCYPIQLRPETGWSRRKLQIQLEDSGIMSRVIFSGNITRHPMLKGHEYRIQDDGDYINNCNQEILAAPSTDTDDVMGNEVEETAPRKSP